MLSNPLHINNNEASKSKIFRILKDHITFFYSSNRNFTAFLNLFALSVLSVQFRHLRLDMIY